MNIDQDPKLKQLNELLTLLREFERYKQDPETFRKQHPTFELTYLTEYFKKLEKKYNSSVALIKARNSISYFKSK